MDFRENYMIDGLVSIPIMIVARLLSLTLPIRHLALRQKFTKYDIIILGDGNAGFNVSAIASEAGKKIAFVEERYFGGTCPNRGCTPKKVLVAAAHALHEIEIASAHCIEVSKPKLDWTKLIKCEKEMISFIPDAMAGVAEKRGDVIKVRPGSLLPIPLIWTEQFWKAIILSLPWALKPVRYPSQVQNI